MTLNYEPSHDLGTHTSRTRGFKCRYCDPASDPKVPNQGRNASGMIALQPGDILMFRIGPGASWYQRLIGWGQRILKEQGGPNAYFHVGFVGPGIFKFYQSKPPAICNSDVPSPLPDYIEVYRLKNPLSDEQLKKIFTYANSQVGKWYNLLGVLTVGIIQIGSFAYCSQFTWQAYTYAGIVLCPWECLESPDDIAASPLLERVF